MGHDRNLQLVTGLLKNDGTVIRKLSFGAWSKQALLYFFQKGMGQKNIKREPINQALIEKPGWSFLAKEKSHN